MQKKIKINHKNFEYNLRRRKGTRCVRLAIYPGGHFVVTAPRWYPLYIIRKFLEEKSDWIYGRLKDVDFQQLDREKQAGERKYKANKEWVRALITERVEFLNRPYNFTYRRIAIKNQKTCWGSASRLGNLNFNYQLINLPAELRDYVIVHELCHLQELNHGLKFWQLVSETIPDYKEKRKKIRKLSL